MTDATTIDTARPLGPAVWNGLRLKCPNCGEGKLLSGYTKVAHDCTTCGQPFHHQKADDGPAYMTILIVGHIMGIALHVLMLEFGITDAWLLPVLIAAALGLSAYLLPRMKGLLVAFQWAKRMHGF